MKEIIIELGILDKIKSAINGVKNYNPYRDANGRFSNSNESKNTDSSLLNRIKSGISGVKDSISGVKTSSNYIKFINVLDSGYNAVLSEDEIFALQDNINNIYDDVVKNIEGINDSSIGTVMTLKDWSTIIGIDEEHVSGVYGVNNTLLNKSATLKNNSIYLSPIVSRLLLGKDIDNIDLSHLNISTTEEKMDFGKRTLVHELLHSRKRDDESMFRNFTDNSSIFEEAATEVLSSLYLYKMNPKKKNDFINNIGTTYNDEVDMLISNVRDKFPNSPKDAVKHIKEFHKNGITEETLKKYNIFERELNNVKENRQWLMENLDISDITLEQNNNNNSNLFVIIDLINNKNYIELKKLLTNTYNKTLFYNYIIYRDDKDEIIKKLN